MGFFKRQKLMAVFLSLLALTVFYISVTLITSQNLCKGEKVGIIKSNFLISRKFSNDLETLSREFQDRIRNTQEQGCGGRTLLCGHHDVCGFGCQIHLRVTCLMVSLGLNIPLIHYQDTWPYKESWNHIFKPLGSNCSINNETMKWDWRPEKRDKRLKFNIFLGVPVPFDIGEKLNKVHPFPFLWVIGQFMKYALKPTKALENALKQWRKDVGLHDRVTKEGKKDGVIVGMHIRRTDKINEAKDSFHDLSEYFTKAESYFTKMEELNVARLPRRVLLFSDDNNILHDARKAYPWWDIRGFNSSTDHTSYLHTHGSANGTSVLEIFRAVFLLSDCDHVICGFSSNVCRVVLEMMSFKNNEDQRQRISSMERSYSYVIYGGYLSRVTTYNRSESVL